MSRASGPPTTWGRWRASCLMAACLPLFAGCADAPAPAPAPSVEPPAKPAPTVTLDRAVLGPLTLPAAEGRWPLVDLLPAGTPPPGAWYTLRVIGDDGGHTRYLEPANLLEKEDLDVVAIEGRVQFEQRLRVPDGASEAVRIRAAKPLRVIPHITSVVIATELVVPDSSQARKLRTQVDGKGAGYYRPAELSTLERRADRCRPEHDAGWPLADVVGLRAPLDAVASVTLTSEGAGDPIVFTGSDLVDAPEGVHLRIKPNRKGQWSFKQLGGQPGCDVLQRQRDVGELAIVTHAATP